MKKIIALAGLILCFNLVNAQAVIYSEPDNNDLRNTNFEIIGKLGGNILIYKSLRDNSFMSVYDMNLKQINRFKLEFIPEKIINADFLLYPEFCYMFYQYQKKGVVYCMAAKFNGEGKLMADPVQLDTTQVNFWANNKMYSIINSEDKKFIGVFKINSKNDKIHLLTTVLFDKELQKLEKEYLNISMPERLDYLNEFNLDNDGNFVFVRTVQTSNDNIQNLFFLVKEKGSKEAKITELKLKDLYLDDIRIKPDNYNNHYIITSLYSKTRAGNIEGLYSCIWDKNLQKPKVITTTVFDDNLRFEARGDNSSKAAFNDYFLRNVIVKRDGGFIVAAEAFFVTNTRGGSFNRGDYLYGSPYLRPGDFYAFSPYGSSYPWGMWNMPMQTQQRYNAQNIAIFSFDSLAAPTWTNVINKTQFSDEGDGLIGYQILNTGDRLHFLYNQQERGIQLLSDQTIAPGGALTRNPTLKNLDRGYDFMPRYGKQIGSRQIIFPCLYRNYLCFARLDL